MTDRLLHMGAEFAERAVVLDDFEERVVAESICAGRLKANPATADVVAVRAYRAGRIGDGYMAHVVGRALFQGSVAKFFEEAAIVRFVGGVSPGEPGRVHARSSA